MTEQAHAQIAALYTSQDILSGPDTDLATTEELYEPPLLAKISSSIGSVTLGSNYGAGDRSGQSFE